MQTRRTFIVLGASAMIASTAGCTERIPFIGDEPLAFESEISTVPQSVLDETGYQEHHIADIVIEETVEAAGRSQDVIVKNWQAEYDKSINFDGLDIPIDERHRAAICSVVTTPRVSVLGRSFNPITDMSSEELAEMVQDRFDELDTLEFIRENSVTVAGESTTAGEFETEASLVGEGVSIDLTVYITEAIKSDEDLIFAVGGYPTDLGIEERRNVFAMMEAISHPG